MVTPHHRWHPRWTTRTAVLPTALTADAASVRAILTLALGVRGLIDVVDGLDVPWRSLVETLLLALLAFGLFMAAQRSYDQRIGWLMAGSIAAGLAIGAFYNFINAGAIPLTPAAGFVVLIAILLFAICGATWQHRRR
jgi:CHASE2 domain-containing sensor protein